MSRSNLYIIYGVFCDYIDYNFSVQTFNSSVYNEMINREGVKCFSVR